ncbi:hypothetical protein BCR33DRAFT_723333 [Rhizoclosmatium globosum]|uniref:Uncharacterized protein n=1 Tax=Rhizoclosmatium globosum TaxID=329046 RepID=A0A1Y2BDS0_9FUNG|nr:hypothetical protein BCR33DRAFT_723333 [Rhizoclosmatium globosum]|eukprot:ORY32988.1 hypothetical protein BCR33DRAFT_723333 [Rhizoclosmatium globosum]
MKTPQPIHTVKFTISATYQLEHKEREVLTQLPKSSIAKKPPAAPKPKVVPITNNDERRSFQLHYSIGNSVPDGKSTVFLQPEVVKNMIQVVDKETKTVSVVPYGPPPVFQSTPVTWSANHDIDVTSDIAVVLLTEQQRIVVEVYEIVKIEVEKKSGLTREMLEGLGIDKDALDLTNRASQIEQSTSMSLSSKDLTGSTKETTFSRATTASGATTADSEDIPDDHHRHHQETPHPHHYDHPEKHMRRASEGSMARTRSAQSLANLALLRPKTPPSPHHCESPLATLMHNRPGSNGPIRMPPPPDLSSMRPKKVPRKTTVTLADGTKVERLLRSGSADEIHKIQVTSAKGEMKTLFEKENKSLPQLNSAGTADQDATSQVSKQDSNSNTNTNSNTTNSSKKKKPTKDKPLPKKRFVYETRKVKVGQMRIDMTNFYCNELLVEGILEHPIDGFISLKSSLSLDIPLLSPTQLRTLNPVSISLLSIENMPKTPISYTDLDTHCLPTTANFQFYNDKHVHEVCVNSKHTRVAAFGTKHVVLAGLLDQKEMQTRILSEDFIVKVYDRIPKRAKHRRTSVPEAPPGLSTDDNNDTDASEEYDWDFFERGVGITRIRASVLPCSDRVRRPHGYNKNMSFPAGHWMEHGTSMVIECQTFGNVMNAALLAGIEGSTEEEERIFGRLVVFAKASHLELRDVIDSIIWSRKQHAQLLTTSVMDPQARREDYVSGYVLTDPEERIYILEGLKKGAIGAIKAALRKLQEKTREDEDCNYMIHFDPDAGFTERIWDCHFETSLDQITRAPRIYVKDVIPDRAYRSLMWLNKLKSMHFLIENTSSKIPYFPSRRTLHSLVTTFGTISQSTKKPDSGRSSVVTPNSAVNSNSNQSSLPSTLPNTAQATISLPPVVSESSFRSSTLTSRLSSKQTPSKLSPTHPRDVVPYSSAKPRLRAPYTANPADCIFNYSMQVKSTTRAQLSKIRASMKKDVCYMYSQAFKLDLGKVEN